MSNRRSAFVLSELGALVVVAGLCALLLLCLGDRSRRLAKVGEDLSHLRQIGVGTGSYGADFEDKVWQLSWRANQVYWSPSDPNAAGFAVQTTDARAAAQQVTYLIRVRGGRTPGETPNLTGLSLWPYLVFSNLALLDYLDLLAPSRIFVSPSDERWKWANDPRGYDMGLYQPNLGIGGYNYRHPYALGFRMGTCFFDSAPIGLRVAPAGATALLSIPGVDGQIGGRPLSLIAHPSQKVLAHDTIGRHFGPRRTYHMFPEARLPVLMCDGAAAVRHFGEANLGANPNQPSSPAPLLTYSPSPIDPPATGPNVGPVYAGTQWTRMGLAGRDFGGPDVYP